jgi:hypothetical protein
VIARSDLKWDGEGDRTGQAGGPEQAGPFCTVASSKNRSGRSIEKAIETAALMLGSDRSRGNCLEMICADFLAGANLDSGDPETLRFYDELLQISARRTEAGIPRRLE